MKIIVRAFLALSMLVSLCFSQLSFALASSAKTPLIENLVNQYYNQTQSLDYISTLVKKTHPPRDCDEDGDFPSCTDVACEKLGQFGCDEMSEINAVNRACRGNYDGNCLGVVCDKLGQFGCDEISEVQKVARACVGNHDVRCFESVCDRLGQFGCDEVREIEEVLRSCAGN